jgi:hypothetical protein
MLQVGKIVEFHYPRTTHVLHVFSCEYRRRRVRITAVRDLVREPLTIAEFLRRPYVLRSRHLITGIDLDRNRERRFYLGCTREYHAPTELRIARYSDGIPWPEGIYFRPIQPTLHDRKLLARALETWSADQSLRVYADDMRVIFP